MRIVRILKSRRARIAPAAATATTLAMASSPAAADITADDVWSNFNSQARALGMEISGDLTATGEGTTISDIRLRAGFPMGLGSFSVTLPKLTLTSDGAGGVAIAMPDDYMIAANATIPSVGFVTAQFKVLQSDYRAVATGVPGNITYDSSIGPFVIDLTDLGTLEEDFDMTLQMRGDGYSSKMQVIEGPLLEVSGTTRSGPISAAYTVDLGPEYQSRATVSYGASETQTTLRLVPDGADLLNLTSALQAGMSLWMTSQVDGTETRSIDDIAGGMAIEQFTSVGPNQTELQIDRNGLWVSGTASNYVVEMDLAPEIGGPIAFDADGASAHYRLPLEARDTPQELSLGLKLDGLRIGPAIWAMFDPEKQLDRSPGSFEIDLGGTANWGIDTLDFLSWEQRMSSGDFPIEVSQVTLKAFGLSALGADLSGSGAVALDYTDMETFDGFPMPVGSVTATLDGFNSLLVQLGSAEILPEDQISMLRLFSGMFARVAEADQLTTTLEVREDGQVFANGERVR